MLSTLLAISLVGQVSSVIDGDTFKAYVDEQVVTVRLQCIDSPEKKQSGGAEATAALKELLPPGQQVNLESVERDRYGRLVANVYKNGTSVSLHQLQSGNAIIYPAYFKACKQQKQQFELAQSLAQKLRLGFWLLPISEQITPWDWRKQRQ